MSRSTATLASLFVLAMLVFPAVAAGNTLSDAYFRAFYNPHGFDSFVGESFLVDNGYYDGARACFGLASPLLHRMEAQERQNYSNCTNNAECTDIAKTIQSITDLKLNVGRLQTFLRAFEANPNARFVDTELGRGALLVYNLHRQNRLDLRENPEFMKQVATLHAVPCP